MKARTFDQIMDAEYGRVICGMRCTCDACPACEGYRAILVALETLIPLAVDAAVKERLAE